MEAWTSLFLPENYDRLPMFRLEVVLDEDGMSLFPRFEQLQEAITFVVYEV